MFHLFYGGCTTIYVTVYVAVWDLPDFYSQDQKTSVNIIVPVHFQGSTSW